MKRIKYYTLLLSVMLILFSGCGEKQLEERAMETSRISTVITDETQISNESIDVEMPVYPTPTNTELSYGFLDYNLFSQYWTGGTLRCGTDFPPGDYYVLSLYGAEAMFDVEDSPNDFSWTYQRVMRKIHAENGQYVYVHGAIIVPAEEVDTENWAKYGVFLVGKDLPEGDYKVVSISDWYNTKIENIAGVCGAYQICEGSPENTPIECTPLFDDQHYISVKNGQYLIINNAKLTLCGIEKQSETHLPQLDTIPQTSESIPSNDIQQTKSITASTYYEMVNLTVKDLKIRTNDFGTWYTYDDWTLIPDDVAWITHPLNKKGTVAQGSVYRKIAHILEGFYVEIEDGIYLHNGKKYAERLIGFIPETREEIKNYFDDISTYVTVENSLNNILRKFSQLNSIEGNFDFINNSYSFYIQDLTACANELQITERLLGYILGELDEYGPIISFEGNSCYFEYTYPG